MKWYLCIIRKYGYNITEALSWLFQLYFLCVVVLTWAYNEPVLLALDRDDDAIGVFDGPLDIWGWCPGGEESDEFAKDKFWFGYFDIFFESSFIPCQKQFLTF